MQQTAPMVDRATFASKGWQSHAPSAREALQLRCSPRLLEYTTSHSSSQTSKQWSVSTSAYLACLWLSAGETRTILDNVRFGSRSGMTRFLPSNELTQDLPDLRCARPAVKGMTTTRDWNRSPSHPVCARRLPKPRVALDRMLAGTWLR